MAYRIFTDPEGTEWQVWDIIPRLNERRDEAERRAGSTPIAFGDRRRDDDRRLSRTHRVALRGTYSRGWLCFDNGREKRRLTPIPADWVTCTDAAMRDYLDRGEPVVGLDGRGAKVYD